MVHTKGIELFANYECYQVKIFFKENALFKRLTDERKWKLCYCYVMGIELAGGGDKLYFASFIHFEILF